MPPFLKTHKLYLMPVEEVKEIPKDLSDILSATSITIEEAEEPDAADAAENDAENDGERLVRMQEIGIPCVIDLEEVLEIAEVYGRPQLTHLTGYNTEYQRVIMKPFLEMVAIWEAHRGEFL